MSRSHQHTPISGITTAASEKEFKRKSNRKLRARAKAAVRRGDDPALIPRKPREVQNSWGGPKDGKRFFDTNNPLERKALRK